MHMRRETFQCFALLLGLLGPSLSVANPQTHSFPEAAAAQAPTVLFGDFAGRHSLLDLPPVLSRSLLPVLVAQAGRPGMAPFFDASQISPLGDPAWVAALRGPDPSKPVINFEAGAPSQIHERDRLPATGVLGGDATVRNGQALRNGRVFLIGAERSALNRGGSILLAPGRAAELGDLGVPFVRVYVAAPAGTPLDVDNLVGRRPVIGIFNALFAPLPARRGDSGATAVASVSVPFAAARNALAGIEVRTVTTQETSAALALAFAAPVEERSVVLLPIPPALVEERVLIAYAAPVEDRSGSYLSIPPAAVEERSFIAFIAPVEERSAWLASIPPATVEERSFVAFVAPVEDRSAMLASIPPATVEERSFIAFAAPVKDKAFAQRPLIPAPIEERAPVLVARVEPPARDIGKPVPGVNKELVLVAAKLLAAPATGLVKVALAAPVVVVAADSNAAQRAEARDPAPAPVTLAAVRRLLPSIMIDRRGGVFFM